jgi:hypothetical protein
MNNRRSSSQHMTVILLVLVLSLAGCTVSTTSAVPRPSATPPPTCTSLPTPTSRLPTPTIVSTLTADQEQALILELLNSNAGCQLPCWWGFTPGATTWQTAQATFAPLGRVIDQNGDLPRMYNLDFYIPGHDIRIYQTYVVRESIIEMIWVGAGMVRGNEAAFGDPQFEADFQPFMVPEFLATYGEPPVVLVKTYPSAPNGSWIPFHLLLFYPERGILVDYQGPGEATGELIRWCPQRLNIALWLWSPESNLTLEDVARTGPNLSVQEILTYQPLEEATGWTIDQFYGTFVQPENQTCLETPADMW